MKLPKRLELPIDIGGLLVALVVDIVMNVVCFATLAPDMITRVAFVAIGVMLVLFVPRSWSKRQFVAWAVFALVVFFFDYSFALVATKAQSTHVAVNVYDDAEVKRLDDEISTHNYRIADLQTQYAAAAKRETMDQLNSMIDAERALSVSANNERSARIREVTQQAKRSNGITSDEIFTAIPDAARDGRIIQLIVFGLIFIGLQLIIATSIDNGVKPIKQIETVAPVASEPVIEDVPAIYEPVHDAAPVVEPTTRISITPVDVDRYVEATWYRVTKKTDMHILPKDVVIPYLHRTGEDISDEAYDVIHAEAHESGLINDDDVIRVTDKTIAANMLNEMLCKNQ